MRITIAEGRFSTTSIPLSVRETNSYDSLNAVVTELERSVANNGYKWRKTEIPHVVLIDVDDPPSETFYMVIDTDAIERVWNMPVKDAISRIVAGGGGMVIEPTRERSVRVRPLKVTPDHVSAMMRERPIVVLTEAAFGDLAEALGGDSEAWEFLATQATQHNKPIAVNGPDGRGGSDTAFIGPEGWSDERVKGWVATNRAALEEQFGEITGPPTSHSGNTPQ